MKYLLFCCHEEKKLTALSKSGLDALTDETSVYCEELQKSGHLIAAEPLEPIQMAITVRVQNGKVSVTDGPYAETKEMVAGFYVIEARDLNEAIAVAARIPAAPLGVVEVRPCRDLEIDGVPHVASSKPR